MTNIDQWEASITWSDAGWEVHHVPGNVGQDPRHHGAQHPGGRGRQHLTNERSVLVLLTNERQVLVLLTNERQVLVLLAYERSVLPDPGTATRRPQPCP